MIATERKVLARILSEACIEFGGWLGRGEKSVATLAAAFAQIHGGMLNLIGQPIREAIKEEEKLRAEERKAIGQCQYCIGPRKPHKALPNKETCAKCLRAFNERNGIVPRRGRRQKIKEE